MNKIKNYVTTLLGVITIILIILTLLSSTLLLIRLINYIKIDDKEIMLTTNMDDSFDLFSVQYENEKGEITVKGAEGQKVIAPGTSVEYTIRLRNADKIALDYELIPEISFTSKYAIPIKIRLLDTDHNYFIGDQKTWVSIDEIGDISVLDTLVKGESKEYYFQWKWDFESGNDEYDTILGENAGKENIGIEVNMNIFATANTDIGTNGGIMKTGLGNIIVNIIILILLIVAVILTILYDRRKHRPEVDVRE